MNSDGEALFRALCELPRDDTPRLVFADWLQENGHPERAELIRLQCEQSNLCPDYPTTAAARTRASELLKRYRNEWDRELPDLAGVEWGGFYVRGFIDKVRIIRADNVTGTLAAVFAAAPLLHLNVTRLEQGQLREVLEFPLLPRLQRLSLPGIYGREEARLLREAQARLPGTEIS
ncbi:MAG TPA: TIGR02996 domain-containing protein [Gemmata sp.]